MAIPEGMITVREAARRLGRSIEQVRRYLREGKLKGQRIGQQWFIEEQSLQLRYQASGQGFRRIGEPALSPVEGPAAVMEVPKVDRERIEALIRRIDEHREAIRKRVGTLDVVELIREIREEH